jgi:hypothetical protein
MGAAAVLLALAVVLVAFSAWGMFTDAGASRFDEMDGLIPFFAGVAGALLVPAAAVAELVRRRRDRNSVPRADKRGEAPARSARLRAGLGMTPNYHAAVLAALRHDDRPLRAAYARVSHTTVADLRDRLAEQGDHERRAWPTFEDYRGTILRSQRRARASDRRLLWTRQSGELLESGWRFAGLDFAEISTRESDGLVREVGFVIGERDDGAEYVVRIG